MALNIVTMKRFIYIISIFAALAAFAGCEKSDIKIDLAVDPELVGEWMLTETVADGCVISDIPSIYLSINADGTFELYQKSGTQSVRYDKFTGGCHTSDGLLKGVYSTGQPWASAWEYSFTQTGMLLQSFNLLEIDLYDRVEIPEDVRKNANEITAKSACDATPIL